MRKIIRGLSIGFLILAVTGAAYSQDYTYGVRIEQRALDLLTLASQRMSDIRGAAGLEGSITMNAKIVAADLFEPGQPVGPVSSEIIEQLPEMIVQTQIELLRSDSGQVRVNLTSNLADLQFLVSDSESLAVLPQDGIFAPMNIPQMLPDKLMLQDDGGLLTLINLMGGIPFGSLLRQEIPQDGEGGPDITFGEVAPEDQRAVIRYWGRDRVEAGRVHSVNILTSGPAPYSQSIRIWVMADTLDLYQISIEDERGTQIFIVFDRIEMNPTLSESDFMIDTSGMAEVSDVELLQALALSVLSSPAIENPVALDLIAASNTVARTGSLTISTDGFDIQDGERELSLEVEYRSPGGSWKPIDIIEYAGLPPLGHWNAIFLPQESAELGAYSFRARYTDSSGNTSEWLEAPDLVTVTPAPPRVVAITPINGDTETPISTQISVTFSKQMDRESVEKNFSVSAWINAYLEGEFSWNGNTLIFTPSHDLRYDTGYLVRIAGEAKDSDGIALDGNFDMRSDGIPYDDYYWSFRTTAAPPTLALESPKRPVYRGDRFNLKIMAQDVERMREFSFKLKFDPEVIEVDKIDMASFASWRPRARSIGEADICARPVLDDQSGFVIFACDNTTSGGVTGSGEIAVLSLHAVGDGLAAFEFVEVSVVNSSGKPIDVDLVEPEMEVAEFHPMDVNRDGIVNILDFVAAASEDEVVQSAPLLTQTELGQNFPNPFNPETWIPYKLSQPSHVIIRIYSSKGEIVRTLDLGAREVGFYTDKTKAAFWDGTDHTGQKVSSGVYFYTIQANGFAATRKMLLCE